VGRLMDCSRSSKSRIDCGGESVIKNGCEGCVGNGDNKSQPVGYLRRELKGILNCGIYWGVGLQLLTRNFLAVGPAFVIEGSHFGWREGGGLRGSFSVEGSFGRSVVV